MTDTDKKTLVQWPTLQALTMPWFGHTRQYSNIPFVKTQLRW